MRTNRLTIIGTCGSKICNFKLSSPCAVHFRLCDSADTWLLRMTFLITCQFNSDIKVVKSSEMKLKVWPFGNRHESQVGGHQFRTEAMHLRPKSSKPDSFVQFNFQYS